MQNFARNIFLISIDILWNIWSDWWHSEHLWQLCYVLHSNRNEKNEYFGQSNSVDINIYILVLMIINRSIILVQHSHLCTCKDLINSGTPFVSDDHFLCLIYYIYHIIFFVTWVQIWSYHTPTIFSISVPCRPIAGEWAAEWWWFIRWELYGNQMGNDDRAGADNHVSTPTDTIILLETSNENIKA